MFKVLSRQPPRKACLGLLPPIRHLQVTFYSLPAYSPIERNRMNIRAFYAASTGLLGALLLVSCNSTPKTTNSLPLDSPAVSMVVPQTSGVGTNREIAVLFNKPMDPATINTSTFLVAGVKGTVTYDTVNNIAGFKATANYAPNTQYNASITTGAKDLSGTPLAAPFFFAFAIAFCTPADALTRRA